MFVSSAEQRSGLLVAVISGGRPRVKERPTARFLPSLKAYAPADIVWAVSEKDAPGYESDGHPLVVYPRDWALEYATRHWMNPTPPDPDGFLGAFPGREWACLEAERRGCWGVLQIDDNVTMLALQRGSRAAYQVIRDAGSLGFFADVLGALSLSTNARMVGAQLQAAASSSSTLLRPGFPYSMFVERVGTGREPWYGPFEDDITHALQYGSRADGATAAVVASLRYTKESRSTSGMRSAYNHERSKQLQRLFPEGAKVGVRKTKSNGLGDPRVFHTMPRGAIRNPVTVTDPALFSAVKGEVQRRTAEWAAYEQQFNREKVLKRARSVTR